MKTAIPRAPYSWYRILSVLWLVIIAFQWIDYTEPIWFKQTTALVTFTMLSVAAIELLPLGNVWRRALKTIAVLAVWRIVLVGYGVYTPEGKWIPDQLNGMAELFTPYMWFSLIAWGAFELSLEFAAGKKRILFFLGVNLASFVSLDSFTSYYLWQNVAWTVFAGLGWLASLHFREFQLKYPNGWSRLRSQPLKVAANVLAIFACVLLVGISMPSVSPVLTDPYTAWKNRNNDTGGGGGAVSAPAAASAAQAVVAVPAEEIVSGYSRDDTELGGGFEFSYSPVMLVDSPVRSYWRGETRREYTGKGWAGMGQEGGRSFKEIIGVSTGTLEGPRASKTEMMEVVQTVTMLNEEVYPVLFGAYAMKNVELLDDDILAADMSWTNEQAELFWNGVASRKDTADRLYPHQYKVVSEIPVVPLEEIQAASLDELYPQDGSRDPEYLQIPDNFPDRVRELAEQITAEGETPYAKMELLRDYLRQNFEYTNKPDLSRRKSEDFVEGFLFEIKQGYCDYFSTTMVMMARSLGVPARWVKGYAPGSQPDPEAFMRAPEEAMGYRVNNADAHSWAELYFGEYGWIPFEATPGFDAPVMYKQGENVVTLADIETSSDVKTAESESGLFGALSSGTLRTIFLILIAGILVWTAYRFRSELVFGFYRLQKGRPLTLSEKAILETKRIMRKLARKGFKRSGDETVREAFGRWKLEDPRLASSLDSLLREFERASYSPQEFTHNQWKIVKQISGKLTMALQTRHSAADRTSPSHRETKF